MGSLVAVATLSAFLFMSTAYVIAQLKKRNDIADVAWGLGFIVICFALLFYSQTFTARSIIITTLVTIWGLRLAAHIGLRHKGRPEDGRYKAMRAKWKYQSLQSFTNVFMLQGFFMLLVSTPIILIMHSSLVCFHWYNALGIVIWLVGFVFEAFGDFQLNRFTRNPRNKGKIMTSGLWKYTRHPNYFGEITQWWGIFLLTLFIPYWYAAAIGPVTITLLILGVSGIPMLEKRYKNNKDHQQYKKQTSAFFPLPQRPRDTEHK